MIDELRAARRSQGWSQGFLAGRIGVPVQTIKRMERGVGSMPNLIAVMAALEFHLVGLASGAILPEQLRQKRRNLSLSLDKAAARAGMTRATISNLESGQGSIASLLKYIAAIAPKATRRAPDRTYWGHDTKSERDSRFTPANFMQPIYDSFGAIDLDPCGHVLSPIVAKRRILLSEGGDGLIEDWAGRLVFVNPPFSRLLIWLRRALEEWQAGHAETVICLVPVRTDSAWFHDQLSPIADIYLLRGRVRFLNSDGAGETTPFSLMLVALGASEDQKRRYSAQVPGYWIGRGAGEGTARIA